MITDNILEISDKNKDNKIETFDDLIRLLHNNPEWRTTIRNLILSIDLMELPQKFNEFLEKDFKPLKQKVDKIEEDVEVLKHDVKILKEDVEVLKHDVKILKEDVEVLKHDVKILKEDVEVLKHDVKILKEDVEVLKHDVKILKEDVEVLKHDVKILKEDVEVLKGDVSILKKDVAGLKTNVAYLMGSDFERTIREKAPAYFGKLIKKCKTISLEDLSNLLDDALDSGLINDKEYEDAILIDVVVKGLLKSNQKQVILATEVSLTGDVYDIERASRRASIITKVSNTETIGVVIANSFTDNSKILADELNVLII